MHPDGHLVVAFEGEWDLARTGEFADTIAVALARTGEALVVDLSEVTFADSTIVAAIHSASERARKRGVAFAVACPSGPLRRIFDLVQLDAVVAVGRTVEDALARGRAARDA